MLVKKVILGIDPGWKSCGLSMVSGGQLLNTLSFIPESKGSILEAINTIDLFIRENSSSEDSLHVVMERFVAYEGKSSSSSEQILMFIGAILLYLEQRKAKIILVRAIDWKSKLCKYLVRTSDFRNPYTSFNKSFSIFVAHELTGLNPEDNHVADAVGISFYGYYLT